jgi:hypothetical protein
MPRYKRRSDSQQRWLNSETRYGILTEPIRPWLAPARFRRVKQLTPEEIAKAFPGVPVSKR